MLDRSAWHTPVPAGHPAGTLLSAHAVRERCAAVADWVESGASAYFQWDESRLQPTARYVAETIRQRHPDLAVPYHARWRHFNAFGIDRWARLCYRHGLIHVPMERARAAIDLVIPSVLLDAGAGPDWHYREAQGGQRLARSEGLGVASLDLFASGAFSLEPAQPLRSDAEALARIDTQTLAAAFQVRADNPLVGLEGRAALLRRLGEVAMATPAVFGHPARLGNLFDYLRAHANRRKLAVSFVLETLLHALGPVWPGRTVLEGVPLGDCWPHPALAGGLVPFHKLTQWLCYSLLEILEGGGLELEGLEDLTGLPEYRNGGLLLDMGLIVPRDPAFFTTAWQVDSPPIVEWRALTVHGLDRLAEAVRWELGLTEASFPLARVLEGGTWFAGRRIAAERRPGGGPPLTLISDGTVF